MSDDDADRAYLRRGKEPASALTDEPSDVDPDWEEGIRAADAQGRDVRPAGWLEYHRVDVAVTGVYGDPDLVLLCFAPGEDVPATLLTCDEIVAIRKWGL